MITECLLQKRSLPIKNKKSPGKKKRKKYKDKSVIYTIINKGAIAPICRENKRRKDTENS